MKATVTPYQDMRSMWIKVLNSARGTVGKNFTETEPSVDFKKAILRSKHSPIRRIKFDVVLEELPAHVSQQFSRHHIAIESAPNQFFSEQIVPTDLEHFVQTSRADRTGIPRDQRKQNDLLTYSFEANAMGLFDASQKRMCHAADPQAIEAWNLVVAEVSKIEPLIADRMQMQCVCLGFCPEDTKMIKCRFMDTDEYAERRAEFVK